MKTSDLLKVVPVAAIALSVCSTSALAGATNRGDNTAATPGADHKDKSMKHKSMKHDKSSKNKDDSMSGSSGGAGSFDNAGGWDPDNPGQYPVAND